MGIGIKYFPSFIAGGRAVGRGFAHVGEGTVAGIAKLVRGIKGSPSAIAETLAYDVTPAFNAVGSGLVHAGASVASGAAHSGLSAAKGVVNAGATMASGAVHAAAAVVKGGVTVANGAAEAAAIGGVGIVGIGAAAAMSGGGTPISNKNWSKDIEQERTLTSELYR